MKKRVESSQRTAFRVFRVFRGFNGKTTCKTPKLQFTELTPVTREIMMENTTTAAPRQTIPGYS